MGVDLAGTNGGFQTESWVKGVSQAFIDGFNASHPTIDAHIAIGTHNQNTPWTCDNNNSSTIDPKWKEAGQRWGTLVASLTPKPYTLIHAANDVEAWRDVAPPWVACGLGTIKWYDGFVEKNDDAVVYNFGSHAFNEAGPPLSPPQWTEEQLYDVSWGRLEARVVPQIYCGSNNAAPWVTLAQNHPIYFYGVTSDNAHSQACGVDNSQYTLPWQQSWQKLQDALGAGGSPNILSPSVESFFYP